MTTTGQPAYPFGRPLDAVQLRVLGALIEKEIATPEQYPLSLNSLVNACNQRSSREPSMDLSESEVRDGLDTLEALELVYSARDSRVTKYEHRIRTVLNLRRDETAVMCLLLLRGPQTPGELRSRADRLYSFDDLAAVLATLERLARRQPMEGAAVARPGVQDVPLTLQMSRQPGSREARYVHLLGEHTVSVGAVDAVPATSTSRLWQIEAEVAALRHQLEGLDKQIGLLQERILRLER